MLDKYRRLGKNTILIFLGNIGSKLISLLMLPLYTRWLTVEEYGTTDIINVYVAFLTSLVTCCISEAIFIFPKNQSGIKQSYYFSSAVAFMAISFGVTLGLFLIAQHIFLYYGLLSSFCDNIWLVFILIFTAFGQEVVQQFCRSINKIRIYSLTGLVQTILITILSFILIPTFHVYGFVFAIALANFLAMLFALIFSRSYKFFHFRNINKEYSIEMLHYCLPLIPNSIMWWIVGALNRPILDANLGLHAIGIFAVANKFPSMLAVVYNIFIQSWQISVLEEFGSKEYSNFYNKIFKNVFLVLLLVSIFISICSKLLVSVFAAESFIDAWKYIPILTFAVLFTNISGFVGSNFIAIKKSKYFLYTSVIGTIVSLLLNILLIPSWGIMGAAVTVLLSHASIAFMRIYFSWRYVKIENIKKYLFLLLLNFVVIISIIYIDDLILKGTLILIVILGIIILNRSILYSFKSIYDQYKKQ